ncbi:homocysteine S-methyltransferase family protein [Macrococcoides canis]|uniref:homocysteine S-methyltransferase family protein n=1 Tax=Macrococcoides canis TaxID=1855823 RepID=UPI0010FC0DB6|nr:homocysteine S-methyltransferase family protein [Macrococcus canis]QCT74123.1 hypothetical protein EST43_02265 [Macrococcus canis]QNR07130.1 hypothetical protein GL258_02320 [Macrococcus canis]
MSSAQSYGAMLGNGSEYTGDYEETEADYIQYHKERLDILIEAGVSVFTFETIPNIEEAVITLLLDYSDIEAWISVTLKGHNHLSDGTPLEAVMEVVNEINNILGFGVNCTRVTVIDATVGKLIALSDKPLILYLNSGRQYDVVHKVWIEQEDASLVETALRWKEKGVKNIGGCCQVGPGEIKELGTALK